jgi:hypothetical protein
MADGRTACGWRCETWAAGLLLVALAAGCQGNIVPVSGEVTLNGKPLAGAVVTFQPVGSQTGKSPQPVATGSVGRTDAVGHYSLRLVHPDRPGAVVGDHAVTIALPSTSRSETEPPATTRLPAAWYDGSKRFRVPEGGTKEANFQIVADAPANPARGKRAGR